MKTIFVSVFLLTLAACQVTPDIREQVGAVVTDAVRSVDRNNDGAYTREEVRAAGKTDALLTAGIPGLLGLIGILMGAKANGSANQANATANRAETASNELYDRTHKPAVPA